MIAKELDLEAYSFHAPFADHIDISSLEPAPATGLWKKYWMPPKRQRSCRCIPGLSILGPESAVIPPREETLQRMENVVEVLNQVAQRCHALGISCVLENKLPHLLFGRTSDILWILDALDSVEVGACLDTGHAAISGDLHRLIARTAGHLKDDPCA